MLMARNFSVSAAAIPSMNVRQVGDVLGDLSKDASKADDLGDSIEEFFRKSFRKVSYDDAMYVVSKLGQDGASKIHTLDNKFWVWETLEEATRPQVDEMTEQELETVMSGFCLNTQGSEDLYNVFYTRIMALGITSPFQSGVNPIHK